MEVKKIVVKSLHTDTFLKSHNGKYLGDEYIKTIVDYDCDCYNEKGDLLFSFRRKVIKNVENAWENFKDVALKTSNVRGSSAGPIDVNSLYFKEKIKDESLIQKNGFESLYSRKEGGVSKVRYSNLVYSTALGNFDVMKRFGKESPCRMTDLTKRYYDRLVGGIPFLNECADWYKTLNRERYDEQYKASTSCGDWNIGETPFSTITINRNFRTGLHKDKGDFGGWAVLSALEDGKYRGGYFMIPKYGVGIDLREGDVLVADVHQYHCNSPFYTTKEDDEYNLENCKRYKDVQETSVLGSEYKWSRVSFVCYLRAKMNECSTDPIKPIKENTYSVKENVGKLNVGVKVNLKSVSFDFNDKVCIPSFKRFENLKKKTLSYLTRHKFNNETVYIFVRNDDPQLKQYQSLMDDGYNVVVLNDVFGIGKTHNAITERFDEGEFVVELDDDINDIIDKDKNSILNFGLYSCPNTYFMKNSKMNKYTYDLKYCLGLVRMRFIRKDIILETNYSEDFENCILHYIRDGKILRNNSVVGITKNYAVGGCKADGRDNETEKKDKEYLSKKYDKYCRLFQRKSGIWDLRLHHYKSK
jgi:hypothetical protein